jgi:23S rRNA (adenine-N6)-dimethyltransferase
VVRRRATARDERRRTHQQHFLVDRDLVGRLAAAVDPGDLVVDVGAGKGVLTLAAARAGARVLAVERDPVWAERLPQRAASAGVADRVRVVHGDLRDVALPTGRWSVIASPPYQHTTTLLHRLLDDPARGPVAADLVLQEEAARKHAASPPRTLLAASWAPWWELEVVERIPRSAFRPVPRVDSAWLRIRRRDPPVLGDDLADVWAGFLREAWEGRPRTAPARSSPPSRGSRSARR